MGGGGLGGGGVWGWGGVGGGWNANGIVGGVPLQGEEYGARNSLRLYRQSLSERRRGGEEPRLKCRFTWK